MLRHQSGQCPFRSSFERKEGKTPKILVIGMDSIRLELKKENIPGN